MPVGSANCIWKGPFPAHLFIIDALRWPKVTARSRAVFRLRGGGLAHKSLQPHGYPNSSHRPTPIHCGHRKGDSKTSCCNPGCDTAPPRSRVAVRSGPSRPGPQSSTLTRGTARTHLSRWLLQSEREAQRRVQPSRLLGTQVTGVLHERLFGNRGYGIRVRDAPPRQSLLAPDRDLHRNISTASGHWNHGDEFAHRIGFIAGDEHHRAAPRGSGQFGPPHLRASHPRGRPPTPRRPPTRPRRRALEWLPRNLPDRSHNSSDAAPQARRRGCRSGRGAAPTSPRNSQSKMASMCPCARRDLHGEGTQGGRPTT